MSPIFMIISRYFKFISAGISDSISDDVYQNIVQTILKYLFQNLILARSIERQQQENIIYYMT